MQVARLTCFVDKLGTATIWLQTRAKKLELQLVMQEQALVAKYTALGNVVTDMSDSQ